MSAGEGWGSPGWSGFAGKCPKCNEGPLFRAYLKPLDECPVCGLKFNVADAGDGPAAFVILIVGFVMAPLVALTALVFAPPVWVYWVVWIPLTILFSLYILQKLKGVFIASHLYRCVHDGPVEAEDGDPGPDCPPDQ